MAVVHHPVLRPVVEVAAQPRPVDAGKVAPALVFRPLPVHRVETQVDAARNVEEAAQVRAHVVEKPVVHEAVVVADLPVHDALEHLDVAREAGEVDSLLVLQVGALDRELFLLHRPAVGQAEAHDKHGVAVVVALARRVDVGAGVPHRQDDVFAGAADEVLDLLLGHVVELLPVDLEALRQHKGAAGVVDVFPAHQGMTRDGDRVGRVVEVLREAAAQHLAVLALARLAAVAALRLRALGHALELAENEVAHTLEVLLALRLDVKPKRGARVLEDAVRAGEDLGGFGPFDRELEPHPHRRLSAILVAPGAVEGKAHADDRGRLGAGEALVDGVERLPRELADPLARDLGVRPRPDGDEAGVRRRVDEPLLHQPEEPRQPLVARVARKPCSSRGSAWRAGPVSLQKRQGVEISVCGHPVPPSPQKVLGSHPRRTLPSRPRPGATSPVGCVTRKI